MHLESELLRLRALVEASRRVHASLDLDELLDNILQAATAATGAERGTVYLCDETKKELWSRVTAGDERLEIHLPYGQGMAGHAAQSGEPLRVDDVTTCAYFDPAVDKRSGFRTVSALCMPIRSRDGVMVAVLQLLNSAEGFSADDLSFLELMGVHVAQALANVQAQSLKLERQRLARELELAREIQTQLLPGELPQLSGLELAARILPCHEIGGDYYDAIPLRGGGTLLLAADVSGKGVPAGLVMSGLQAALWATAGLELTLEGWAAQLGDMLHHRLRGMKYVTGCFLMMAADGRRGHCLNAGHPPALIAGPSGIRRMAANGVPLGLLPGQRYTTTPFTLAPGETLLLYTDGLTDAADADGDPLEIAGVEKLLREAAHLSAPAAADQLMAAVNAYSPPGRDCDDRTVLLVKAIGA